LSQFYPALSILQVLLCLGYCHLLHLRDAAACLKCCEALRQLETEQAAHPAVALLAFQAFMAQGSLEQAEKEATGERHVFCAWCAERLSAVG
jgi:hypothetical protein